MCILASNSKGDQQVFEFIIKFKDQDHYEMYSDTNYDSVPYGDIFKDFPEYTPDEFPEMVEPLEDISSFNLPVIDMQDK